MECFKGNGVGSNEIESRFRLASIRASVVESAAAELTEALLLLLPDALALGVSSGPLSSEPRGLLPLVTELRALVLEESTQERRQLGADKGPRGLAQGTHDARGGFQGTLPLLVDVVAVLVFVIDGIEARPLGRAAFGVHGGADLEFHLGLRRRGHEGLENVLAIPLPEQKHALNGRANAALLAACASALEVAVLGRAWRSRRVRLLSLKIRIQTTIRHTK